MSTEMPHERLLAAFAGFDESNRTMRVERSMWASQHVPAFSAIQGRPESLALLEEARSTFVSGHHVAALIVAMAYVEHAIADALNPAEDTWGPSMEKAIRRAKAQNLFDSKLLERADRLREIRNAYAHRRPHDDKDTLTMRFRELKEHPKTVQERDAQEALEVMYGSLGAIQHKENRP